jgi:hypothetical protein
MVIVHEFTPLTRRFWRQATWFENHAKLLRSCPSIFNKPIHKIQAQMCDNLVELCEQLGEITQREYERRASLRDKK